MTTEQLGVIWTHLKAGQSNRAIAQDLGFDRKTINFYAARIRALAFDPETPYEEVLKKLSELLPANRKAKPSMAALEPYANEIRSLITGDRAAGRPEMKSKTAWQVIRERHSLDTKTSYETFKRFVRKEELNHSHQEATVRIETDPGDEIQIDYGKMGSWFVDGKNRIIQAFIGTLAFSRVPFVQFVTSQDEVSFARSNVAMFDFYQGTPRRINLDNLKAGVIKAHVYDPTINRTFAELCYHYGVTADPARVASPKDKGKVERMVQIVRELWKRLTALHPNATLPELNELAACWSRNEYGQTKHGTTGVRPWESFETIEKTALKSLPDQRFIPASWSIAKVHPDQFVMVKNKLYGLPAEYIGKTVDIRQTQNMVDIFYNHNKIRSYTIPSRGRAYLPTDFPAYGQPFVPGSFAASLIYSASTFGPQPARYIRMILEDGGNLAIRRAQGCLAVIKNRYGIAGFSRALGDAIARKIFNPVRLDQLLQDESKQNVLVFPQSEQGTAMTRDAGYYAGQ